MVFAVRPCTSLALVAAAVSVGGCRGATEIDVTVTTDLDCARVTGGASITPGELGKIEGAAPATTSHACKDGRLGAVVIVPSGADDAIVAFKVVVSLDGQDVETCTPHYPPGCTDPSVCTPDYGPACIVARRALHFVPHTTLNVPVILRGSCAGVSCPSTATCVAGRCVSATIDDSSKCESPAGCGEEGLGGAADAGVDATVADGSADATISDAPADVASPDAAVFDGAVEGCNMHGLEPGAPYPMVGYCPSHRFRSPMRGPKASPTLVWNVTSPGDIVAEPIVSRDGTIYVSSRNASLYALAPDGGARWTFTVPYDAGADAAGSSVSGSVALAADSTVWVMAREPALALYALSPVDGHVVGTRAVSDSESALTIGPDGTIYYTGVGEDLVWIAPDGTVSQAYPSGGADFTTPAIGDDGTMYVATALGEVRAIAADGGTSWSAQRGAGAAAYLARGPDGSLRVATNALYALQSDGGAIWSAPAPFGPIHGIAVGDDGLTVVAQQSGAPFAVSAGGASTLGSGAFTQCTQPVLDADGWSYMGCAGAIVAFDASLKQQWSFPHAGTLNGAPVLGANGTLYFTADATSTTPLRSGVYAIR
jgi:hypothetical protein